jgi:hypothetical protein
MLCIIVAGGFEMKTIKAYFDGEKIILPEDFDGKPGEVLIVLDNDTAGISALSEAVFAEIWDNPEDAEYDSL